MKFTLQQKRVALEAFLLADDFPFCQENKKTTKRQGHETQARDMLTPKHFPKKSLQKPLQLRGSLQAMPFEVAY